MYFHSLVALIGTVTIGLAALPAQAEEEYDPFEETNRKISACSKGVQRGDPCGGRYRHYEYVPERA